MKLQKYGSPKPIRSAFVAVLVSLLLAACGGGSGSGNGDDDGMMPPSGGGTGGNTDGNTGGDSGDGTGDDGGGDGSGNGGDNSGDNTDSGNTGGPPVPTLAEVYSSATATDHSFDAISAAVRRNDTDDNTSIPEDGDMELAVSSIRRNTGGGYDITYIIDDAKRIVTFLPEHCDGLDGWCRLELEGEYIEFWTMFSGNPLDLTTDMEYFSVAHLNTPITTSSDVSIAHRQMFVFGVETPAAAVPSRGEAVYSGWFRADAYRRGSSSGSYRQRFNATMKIVANFDMSSLDGEVFSVRGSQPGQSASSDRVSWPTSSFRISGGRINSQGQFTATLTGMDSDPSVPDNESVRGFMGEIVGRLFGPNAEELGGAVSASRDLAGDDSDLNLYGYVAARRLGPAHTLGSAALTSGMLRKYAEDATELLEDDGMATIERTTGGWRIRVDGRTVELRDRDYGSRAPWYYTYSRDVDDGRVWFWSETDWRFDTRV